MIIVSLYSILIAVGTCDEIDITNFTRDDSILINFESNYLLKFNRTIQCGSNSSFSIVDGCVHHCTGLGYGQRDKILIQMYHDNGTIEEECFIDYTIRM
jgi:hypothetical protein